jgi:hypothetical protein
MRPGDDAGPRLQRGETRRRHPACRCSRKPGTPPRGQRPCSEAAGCAVGPALAPGLGRTRTGRLWVAVRDERPWGYCVPPAVVYRGIVTLTTVRCGGNHSVLRQAVAATDTLHVSIACSLRGSVRFCARRYRDLWPVVAGLKRLPIDAARSPSCTYAASAVCRQERVGASGIGSEGSCGVRRGIGSSVPLTRRSSVPASVDIGL